MQTIIAEPDGQAAQRLVSAAGGVLGAKQRFVAVDTLAEAREALSAEEGAVLVIGPNLVDGAALELASHAVESRRSACVLVPESIDAELLRAALRAGVSDVVALSEPTSDIGQAIGRAAEAARRALAGGGSSAIEETPVGRVLTVFSTKGGVGKTVLATNLAVALAHSDGVSVAVLDLDLEFGDVGIMMGLTPEHTLFDAVQVFDRLDAEMLDGLMMHHSSGAKVLLAPVRPEDAEPVSAARIAHIIKLLRDRFDYLVIDTSPSFSEPVLAALDRSDEVFVITMMDVASIKNTRISLQKLSQLGYDASRVHIVLNRADSKVLLEPAEVEKAIGGKIHARIPSDRSVPRSVNKGIPVIVDMPRSEVSKSISSIVRGIIASGVTKEAHHVA